MRKTGTAKVVRDVDRLISRIAEHEAQEQRALTSRQTIGTVLEKATQRIGRSHPRSARRPRADVVERQHSDDMSSRQPTRTGWRSLEAPHEQDTLPRLRKPQPLNPSARPSDRLNVPTIIEAHVGAHP